MPFSSKKQERFMFSQHPDIAKRWAAEQKAKHEPMIKAADLDLYKKQIADAYRDMTKPAETKYGDAPGTLDLAAKNYQANPTPENYAALHNAQVAADAAVAPIVPAAPVVPTGPTLLPEQNDQSWMQNYAPAPMANSGPAGISLAEEKQQADANKAQLEAEKRAAVDAAKPKAVDASKVAIPGQGSGSEKESSSTPSRDVSLISPGRPVPAREVPTIDPTRIGQLSKDVDAITAANEGIGQAQNQAAIDRAEAERQKAVFFAKNQQEILQKAKERDDYLQMQERQLAQLSQDAANQKIDPWRDKGLPGRIAYGIAAALGGFVAGRRGTPNYVMQDIQKNLDREMQAQREEIEAKKGHVAQMQGLLAESYRRFGNMDQAEAAARAVALQQIDAEQQAWAAAHGDPVQLAQSKLLTAKLQFDADKEKASLFQYQPAHMAGGITAAQQKQMIDLAAKFQTDAAANGHEMSPEEARRRAAATIGLTASTGAGYVDMAKQPRGANVSQKDVESIRAHEAALENIDKLIEMRQKNNGGSFSPTDKRVAHALAARAQENLVAALGKTNQGLLDRTSALIPDDPLEHNLAGVTGADPTLAGLQTARDQMISELSRIQKTPGAGETAPVEELPQGEPEE